MKVPPKAFAIPILAISGFYHILGNVEECDEPWQNRQT